MLFKLSHLAVGGLSLALTFQASAESVVKKADCYQMEYSYDEYDENGDLIIPRVLGTDPWNNKITDYKKVMELRLKQDGSIDVHYTNFDVHYGNYSYYLMENSFLNYRFNQNWINQPVYFDWGKNILQLRDASIEDDPWGDHEIPLLGEYHESSGHLFLERNEKNDAFNFYTIKEKDEEEEDKTLKLTSFSTMYRPYRDADGNIQSMAGDSLSCHADQLEALYQEISIRGDFNILRAPKKIMTADEVKNEVVGKLAKSIECQAAPDVTKEICDSFYNVVYSGLLRLQGKDLIKDNPQVSELINKDIKSGHLYDYEYYDEENDRYVISPELKETIFLPADISYYQITKAILKALDGEEVY